MSPQAGPAAPFVAELQQEAVATRRLLERVPAGKLSWRPHAKSHTLGQLALHVATVPGIVTGMIAASELDASKVDFRAPQPESVGEVQRAFEHALSGACAALSSWTATDLAATWRLVAGPKELMAMPKGAMLRSLVLNHLYHHRGQLTVYLRMLDVPLPSVYGPSGDEQVFG